MDYCEGYWNSLNEKEDQERRSRLRRVMIMKEKEAQMASKTRYCPHCHMQLTPSGHCINGCDD